MEGNGKALLLHAALIYPPKADLVQQPVAADGAARRR